MVIWIIPDYYSFCWLIIYFQYFNVYSSLWSFIFLVVAVYGIQGVPRTIGVLQPMLLFFAIMGSRLGIKYILMGNFNFKKHVNKKNVLVYGAGVSGRQLIRHCFRNYSPEL